MRRHHSTFASGSAVAALPVVLAVAVSLLLAGCSGEQEGPGAAEGSRDDAALPAGGDPGMGHVHGLGVDADSGDVLAATHTGLFRLRQGSAPQRVAERWQDTMGFTVDGDRLLGSGHPDPREELPPHLGLVQSTDAGQTWTTLSLQGEADFHALSAAGEQVVGWDSTAGAIRVSEDGGRSWTTGASPGPVADLEHLPDGRLLATTADGLLVSEDGGRSLQPYAPAPPDTLVHVESAAASGTASAGGPVGLDVEGRVWSETGGTWSELGTVGAAPAAFAVAADGTLLAATDETILRSADADTWTVVAELHGGKR